MDLTLSSPLNVEQHAWNSMEVLLSASTGVQRRTLAHEMRTLYHTVQSSIWPLRSAETIPSTPPRTGILSCFKTASQQITSLRNQSPCKQACIFHSQERKQSCQKVKKTPPSRIPRNERVTLPPLPPLEVPNNIPEPEVVQPTSPTFFYTMPESGSSGACPASLSSRSSSTSSSVISSQPESPSTPVRTSTTLSTHRRHSLSSSQVQSSLTTPTLKRMPVPDESSPFMPVLSPVLPVEPSDNFSSPSMPVLSPTVEPGSSIKRCSVGDEFVCQPFLCTKKLSFSPVPKASSKQRSERDADIIRRWTSTYPKSSQKQEPQQPQNPQGKPYREMKLMTLDEYTNIMNKMFSTSCRDPEALAASQRHTKILTLSEKDYDDDFGQECLEERGVIPERSSPRHPTTATDTPRTSLSVDCAKRKLAYNNNKLIPLKKRFNPNFKIPSPRKPDTQHSVNSVPLSSSPPRILSVTRGKGEKKPRNKSGKRSYKGASFEIGGTNRSSRSREPIESSSTQNETVVHLRQVLASFMSQKKTSTSIIIHSSKQTRLIEFAGLCYISAVRITGGVRLRKNSYSRAPLALDVEWMMS